jgi:hypothetical protein
MSDTAPADPLAPVLTWFPLLSAAAITNLPRELPGIWVGSGLELAGIEPMSETRPEHLERLVAAQTAYEVILLEPPELAGTLDRQGTSRTAPRGRQAYLEALTVHAIVCVPHAVQEVWDADREGLRASECRFAVSMWAHPVSTCWPVPGDAWHAHCVVLGHFWTPDVHDS